MSGSRGKGADAATTGGIAFTVALLGVTLLLLFATADLRASAAFVPRAVGVPLVVLLLYRLLRDSVALRRDREVTTAPSDRTAGEGIAVLWLLALPALATGLGFVAGPAAWVIAWARFRAGERTTVAIGAGAIAALFIFVIFDVVLGARLPQGVFGG